MHHLLRALKRTAGTGLWLIVPILVFLVLAVSCVFPVERSAPFRVRNGTDETLSLSISASYSEGFPPNNPLRLSAIVEPGKEFRTDAFFAHLAAYNIEAKDIHGNVVFSKVFKRDELEKIRWRITITKNP